MTSLFVPRRKHLVSAFIVLFVCGLSFCLGSAAGQSKYGSMQREQSLGMLKDFAEAVRKNYYDSKLRGVDFEKRVKSEEDWIRQATHLGEALTAVAALVEPLQDSHTFFTPPDRPFRVDYGFVIQAIGQRFFVTALRPKTDAEAKLKVGDEILTMEGFVPTRRTWWSMEHIFERVDPRPRLRFEVRGTDNVARRADVFPKVTRTSAQMDFTTASDGRDIWKMIREQETAWMLRQQRSWESGDAALIWKMPEFILTEDEMDHMIGLARKHKTLILDLRGNPGGSAVMLEQLVGSVMDRDVQIAKRVGGKLDLKPQEAKTRGKDAFTGKLIVLIDSRSASAAELFARVVQLEKRGVVIGDTSSGAVMEARFFFMSQGIDTKIFYGASITEADLIMADGRSLENNGVAPDEVVLPTTADLATGSDPVLSRAAELAGIKIDSAAAGKLFPIQWMPE